MRAIEIQVFCMTDDHLTQRDEDVEYYDVLVSYEPDDDGSIEEIEEFENLSQAEIDELIPKLEEKYGVSADTVDGT